MQELECKLTETARDHLNRYKARVNELCKKQMKLDQIGSTKMIQQGTYRGQSAVPDLFCKEEIETLYCCQCLSETKSFGFRRKQSINDRKKQGAIMAGIEPAILRFRVACFNR